MTNEHSEPALEGAITSAAWPECEEFFDLMQAYRHAPLLPPDEVLARYEAVKAWLRRVRPFSQETLKELEIAKPKLK